MRKDLTTSVEIMIDDPYDDLLISVLDEIRAKVKSGIRKSQKVTADYEYYFEVIVKE